MNASPNGLLVILTFSKQFKNGVLFLVLMVFLGSLKMALLLKSTPLRVILILLNLLGLTVNLMSLVLLAWMVGLPKRQRT